MITLYKQLINIPRLTSVLLSKAIELKINSKRTGQIHNLTTFHTYNYKQTDTPNKNTFFHKQPSYKQLALEASKRQTTFRAILIELSNLSQI